ncbi:SusC/RagA family TonB-linked outer membrane protein [Flavivirga sp. 57AJ16]|uniref:SusC/RagA family TonB-linked outer membrane protein n=1 Tax=Flavivirga sp. 57AJ16 TaxID=3025307 RepID=UPI0023660934|nr:SusC/RagA family TonB-linked outer membrane protein [Flavivirga sp. 57AJ16]MDD7884925.1 carboxypeptidase-like regulatory domain-containing protein [Flavivirga sp. 57AJ16]
MKIYTLLLFVTMAKLFAVDANGQNVTINVNNKELRTVFNKIEKITKFNFFYNNSLVDVTKKVSLKAKNQDLNQVLASLFESTDIDYRFLKNQIILFPKNDKSVIKVIEGLINNENLDKEIATIITDVLQNEIKGKVVDAKGVPLVGVNIIIQGTSTGAQSNFDGEYRIQANNGAALVFSYIGFKTQTITVGDSNTINVTMEEDASQLDEIVVTALGIKKTRKSLTYAAQDIDADELNKAKQTNPINSLSGKVSGVSITRSASGVGGSVKVTLRGNSSIGNNQPLYVVDGIPLSNPSGGGPPSRDGNNNGGNSGQPGDTFGDLSGGNRDGGDALALINPDDIESLTVLKGASASALYGSAGLNGVILITTKKGRAGSFKVDFSSNLTVDSAAYSMDFNGEAQGNIDDFLETGVTNINSLSVSGGTEKAQTYFSYSNTFASGVLPTNRLKQHTFNVRETAKLFDDRLNVSASVMASSQNVKNKPVSGLYFNPLVGAYAFESDTEKLSDYANFETFDESRFIMAQRWFRGTSDIEQNPYWIINRNVSEDRNNKLVASLSLDFKINDWLSIQTRGTYDKSLLEYEKKIYATTEATLAPLNGRYIVFENDFTQYYGDVIANINTQIDESISITAIVGTSTTRNTTESFFADSGTNGGLQFANVFSFQNFNGNPSVNFTQNSLETRVNSVFSSATIGFEDKIFVDLTARNDWSSTLPASNNSFFYPSIGVTGILSELLDLPVSFAKIRASYAEVGNGFAPDRIAPNKTIIFGGGGVSPTDPIKPFPGSTPKPERQKSFEIGTEWKFSNNRYGIDLGYYATKTVDQYYPFSTSVSIIGAPQAYLNSGEISNKGFEASVFAIPIQRDNLRWTTTVNFAANKNKIEKIYNGQVLEGLIEPEFFTLSGKGVNTFGSYLVEGGSFGDIYAQVVRRNENGLPIIESDAVVMNDDNTVDGLTKVGNANPDFTLGWNNSFEFKNFTVDFLIDGKFGGETMSMTEAIVEGFSNNSARETANGLVSVQVDGSETTMPAQEYYGKVGGRNGFTGEYIYSATNVRLAEFAIGYNFNLAENSFFSRVKASVVGNNLLFFYKDAPHDPNVSLSTGNALQGVDALGLPSTRSIGLNLNLTF